MTLDVNKQSVGNPPRALPPTKVTPKPTPAKKEPVNNSPEAATPQKTAGNILAEAFQGLNKITLASNPEDSGNKIKSTENKVSAKPLPEPAPEPRPVPPKNPPPIPKLPPLTKTELDWINVAPPEMRAQMRAQIEMQKIQEEREKAEEANKKKQNPGK